jgi:dihydrofolate reductase
MARLVYSIISSLDGYVADRDGNFDWAAPDEEVHAFVNDSERPIGTYLFGRRMYETMKVWETMATADEPPVVSDFASMWKSADKVVYSRTLDEGSVDTSRTRLERGFDPAAVARLKEAAARDVTVGGPGLAGQALRAGLVDACRVIAVPVIVGGGTRTWPDDVRVDLAVRDVHRFRNGFVAFDYDVVG